MKSFFIVIATCISSFSFSQNYNESQKIELLQKKGIEISISDLKSLSDFDFDLIKNYNFDIYRNDKTDRQIQFVKGPKATVKSFTHCKENQISYDEKISQTKQNEVVGKTNISIITQVNIGLGYNQNELNPEKY